MLETHNGLLERIRKIKFHAAIPRHTNEFCTATLLIKPGRVAGVRLAVLAAEAPESDSAP